MGAGRLAPAQRNNFVRNVEVYCYPRVGWGERGGAGLNSIYRKIEEITLIEIVCRPAGLESFYFSNITRP